MADGDVVEVGTARITVLAAPGHTPESATFRVDGEALLTGDTLFLDGVGRPDLEAGEGADDADIPFVEIFKRATYGDRTLLAAAQAGHVENFVDTLVWIAFPLFLVANGLDVAQVGVVVGVHSAAYFLQIYTGRLGDRIGRKPPIAAGFVLAGIGVLGMVLVEGYLAWIVLSALAGVGMALHYPNLISVASDASHPLWRSTGLGVYRMWRDLGYAVGAVFVGLVVDLWTIEAAFVGTALAMFVSGAYVVVSMEETLHGIDGSQEEDGRSPADSP